jgi:Tol biopolymer transport system component
MKVQWIHKLFFVCFTSFITFFVSQSQEIDSVKKLTVIGMDNAEWSPEGLSLLFTSNFSGHWNIYKRDLKTGNVQRLTTHHNDDENPLFSPDGKYIIYSSEEDNNSDVWIMNANGSGQKNISKNPATDFHPTWHPDGKTILFNSNRDDTSGFALYTMKPDGSDVKRLTDPSGFRTYASWPPDAKSILFVKWLKLDSAGEQRRDICVMDANGKNEKNLTNSPAALNGWPSWSPDGKQIIFSAKQNANFQLYIINRDGTGLKQLIHSAYDDRRARWSKDGKKIAFDRRIPGTVTDIQIAVLK